MGESGGRRYAAVEMAEGAGARVRRLFPTSRCPCYDPFVLFDEFFVEPGAGFPEHPHRGFEAITYMLAGAFRHRDTLGNDEEVGAGGVQRFSAGSGIVHSEMPGEEPLNYGFQLWINLSPEDKKGPPEYQRVVPEEIPVRRTDNAEIRTVVGPGSPVRNRTAMLYLDTRLDAGAEHTVELPPGFRGFVYVYSGELTAGDHTIRSGESLLVECDERVSASSRSAARFIAVAGKPYGVPIVIRGSFVE